MFVVRALAAAAVIAMFAHSTQCFAKAEQPSPAPAARPSAARPLTAPSSAFFGQNRVQVVERVDAANASCRDLRQAVYRSDAVYLRQGGAVRLLYRSSGAVCASDEYLAPARARTADGATCEAGYACRGFVSADAVRERDLRLENDLRGNDFESPRFALPPGLR